MKILFLCDNIKEAKDYIEKNILKPKESFKEWPEHYELENNGYVRLLYVGSNLRGYKVDKIYIPKRSVFNGEFIYPALKYSKEKAKIIYY